MLNLEEKIALAREKLEHSDAVLLGAGAGLSAAAGLDYFGPAFKKEFADYIKKYGFSDLYSSSFFEFPTEAERWTRWARHINYARYQPGPLPLYKQLLDVLRRKNYFVITTNVDGQFAKAGFDIARIFEVQGNYGQMQCARGCHTQVYSNEEAVRQILDNASDLTIPDAIVPHCPVCGGNMDVHVRKNRFFIQDATWEAEAENYEAFIQNHLRANLLLLELGVGFNTPDIIRFPFEKITFQNPESFLIRINKNEAFAPEALGLRVLGIYGDLAQIIDAIAQK